jgi:hypothetical protein
MRAIALIGIALKSTGVVPRPILRVGVDQRRGVHALAVDQHQHLVRAEPAQLRRAHVIGAAGVRLARKVERGQQRRQCRAELAVDRAGTAQVLCGEHVDRGHRVERGAIRGARAGDDDRIERLRGFFRGGVRTGGEKRQRQDQRRVTQAADIGHGTSLE